MAERSELTKQIAEKAMEGYAVKEGIAGEAAGVRLRQDVSSLLRRRVLEALGIGRYECLRSPEPEIPRGLVTTVDSGVERPLLSPSRRAVDERERAGVRAVPAREACTADDGSA